MCVRVRAGLNRDARARVTPDHQRPLWWRLGEHTQIIAAQIQWTRARAQKLRAHTRARLIVHHDEPGPASPARYGGAVRACAGHSHEYLRTSVCHRPSATRVPVIFLLD